MTNDAKDDPSEGLLLEESADDHDEAAGLELDARQSAELRQIFLTTLPDYLEPMREMIARLSSEPEESDETRRALAKTIVSIVDAASRVNLDDVARSMESLREDVMLLGDVGEPQQPLRERITKALDALGALAGPRGVDAGSSGASETIVAATQGMEGIDASALQKLIAAGVVRVDQLLGADPKDVVAVSGLDAPTVGKLIGALRDKGAPPSEEPPPPQAEAALQRTPDVEDAIRNLVDEELWVDEARGESLRLRLTIQALRAEISGLERQCHALRATVADAREGAAERTAVLGEVQRRSAELERDRREAEVELEKITARSRALEAERREALEELGHVANDASSLSERLTRLLDDPKR